MIYKMNCIRCDKEMEYEQIKDMENLGLIGFKCLNCDENYLVPVEFPGLIKREGRSC